MTDVKIPAMGSISILVKILFVKNSTNASCSLSDSNSYCPIPVKNSMLVNFTYSNEVDTILRKLLNSKSPGYDNIGLKLKK